MTALVRVERSLARLPTRIPYSTIIIDIEITAAIIHRNTIITIASDTTELSILVEIVTTTSITYQTKEILIAEVVDPREWCCRISDDELTVLVIKIAEIFTFHFLYFNSLLIAIFTFSLFFWSSRSTSSNAPSSLKEYKTIVFIAFIRVKTNVLYSFNSLQSLYSFISSIYLAGNQTIPRTALRTRNVLSADMAR